MAKICMSRLGCWGTSGFGPAFEKSAEGVGGIGLGAGMATTGGLATIGCSSVYS